MYLHTSSLLVMSPCLYLIGFILLKVSFEDQKYLRNACFDSYLGRLCEISRVLSKESLPNPSPQRFSPVFSSRIFVVSGFTYSVTF